MTYKICIIAFMFAAISHTRIDGKPHPIPYKRQFQKADWYNQASLTQGQGEEGWSVALSGDGNTLAASAYSFNNSAGATQIYTRSGSDWMYEITLTRGASDASEGSAVALSADGTTLAAGSVGFNNTGATQIYVMSSTGWQYQATLTRGIRSAEEGSPLAISIDGNTLIVGGITLAPQIYVRFGTTWQYQTTASNGTANAIALSAAGNALALGFTYLYDTGATEIYVKSGMAWDYQGTVSQKIAQSYEGSAVALSADGNTLAVGCPGNPGTPSAAGATQIYVRSGATWQHQATLTQGATDSLEGSSVSLSIDGNTLAVGAPGDTNNPNAIGKTQIYVRSGSVWEHNATLSKNIAQSGEGFTVALSYGGATLAAGAPFAYSGGEAEIYVDSDY